ncbi:hypothetical protein NKH77_55280 [Streptomyces sp. M19]
MRTITAVVAMGVLAASALVTSSGTALAESASVDVDFSHQIATSSNLVFGLSAWPKLDAKYAEEVADAGVTITRSDVYLYDVIPSHDVFDQDPDDWNWDPDDPNETTTDSDIDAFNAAGVKRMLIIHGFPEWMGTEEAVPPGTATTTPADHRLRRAPGGVQAGVRALPGQGRLLPDRQRTRP